MEVNERVKTLRKELKLTMEAFGSKLGVGKTAISKIENNERNLTEQMLRAICREFNVSESWLRSGEGEPFVNRSREQEIERFFDEVVMEDGFKKRFVAMLARLDEDDWELIERMALELTEGHTEAAPVGSPESVAQAEADYEKRFGIVRSTGSGISHTSG